MAFWCRCGLLLYMLVGLLAWAVYLRDLHTWRPHQITDQIVRETKGFLSLEALSERPAWWATVVLYSLSNCSKKPSWSCCKPRVINISRDWRDGRQHYCHWPSLQVFSAVQAEHHLTADMSHLNGRWKGFTAWLWQNLWGAPIYCSVSILPARLPF